MTVARDEVAMVRIGFIGPLTGAPAAKGLSARNSAILAVARRNARIDRRWTYELVVADDACDPAIGVEVAERMAGDPTIVAGITHYCSQVALACINVYHRHRFPVVVWGAHHSAVTDAGYLEVHRVSGVFANEDEAAADFMLGRGFRRWMVLHDATHYGSGHAAAFTGALRARGVDAVLSREIAVDQQDFRCEIDALSRCAAEVVYIATAPDAWWATSGASTPLRRPPTDRAGWMPAPARLCRQLAERSVRVQLQGPASLLRDKRVIKDMGSAGDGVIALEEGAPIGELPGGPEFAADYAAHGFAEPWEAFGPFAYAATSLVMDVIDEVGTDRRRIRETLNAVRDHPSLIGPINFNDKGQNVTVPVTVYVAAGGQWVPWKGGRDGVAKTQHSVRTD
jgi:branched-chain amino acid transport system substrate-binding protein